MESDVTEAPRVLAEGTGTVDQAVQMALLYSTGLWDTLSMQDRKAWFQKAQVLDTPGGRVFLQFLDRLGVF